jgi:hypothetical protein
MVVPECPRASATSWMFPVKSSADVAKPIISTLCLRGCSNGGNPPSIVFKKVTRPNRASQNCSPPAIPAPPIPLPGPIHPPVSITLPPPATQPSQCAVATEAITGFQKRSAAAQEQLNGPACTGTARFDCERTVQTDQSALTAVIAHKNQVCNPRFSRAESVVLGSSKRRTSRSRTIALTCVESGQGSAHIRLLPNRKNLLRIDYSKL